MFDIETNFDCNDFPATFSSTTELFDNEKNSPEETTKTFLKPAIPLRKTSKCRKREKDDLRIQKALTSCNGWCRKKIRHIFLENNVSQKLYQFDAEMEKLSAEAEVYGFP